jgi:hypothetical protein
VDLRLVRGWLRRQQKQVISLTGTICLPRSTLLRRVRLPLPQKEYDLRVLEQTVLGDRELLDEPIIKPLKPGIAFTAERKLAFRILKEGRRAC